MKTKSIYERGRLYDRARKFDKELAHLVSNSDELDQAIEAWVTAEEDLRDAYMHKAKQEFERPGDPTPLPEVGYFARVVQKAKSKVQFLRYEK